MKRIPQKNQSALFTALALALTATVCTSIVGLVHWSTSERIELSRLKQLNDQLEQILSADLYDNNLLIDTVTVKNVALGSDAPQTIWRARLNERPVAAILTATAPNGYGGPISLLIGIMVNGDITSTRVLQHRETPGLGDDVDISRSDWIQSFNGQSLQSLTQDQWKVKKDGGVFDQFTGATITPRAITSAVYSALNYFKQNQEIIFAGHK